MPKPSHHKKSSPRTSTRSGAEAAEGMKAVSGTRGEEPTRSKKGKTAPQHSGNEPLDNRTIEHESGYGGKENQPRVSSDERENVASDGSLRSETKKR